MTMLVGLLVLVNRYVYPKALITQVHYNGLAVITQLADEGLANLGGDILALPLFVHIVICTQALPTFVLLCPLALTYHYDDTPYS